jgi:hypothetical protein
MKYIDGIDYVSQLAAGLECIEVQCNLYIDGFWKDEIEQIYSSFPPLIPTTDIEAGTRWPTPRTKHLGVTKEFLKRLHILSKRHAAPELFDHFALYGDNGLLMEGFDFPGNEIEVFDTMPSGVVKKFCALSNSRLAERDE